ncbi:class I SAM-dependent methyltransferase [Pseudoroseomonas globiformis]|uniref:Class I SAM-dependent methyltransferase n=1 Tax=Teichococcus globiformis TaxID=2307229 RepID=A0ABV7G705_9PROT
MAQNIYDRPDFFAGYSQLSRSVHGLAGAPEWPTIQAMLPDVTGLRIVDLGCGFGWFSRWAAGKGAADILGLDLSEKMLARARAETSDARIRYERADLETLALPEQRFDLAYSALAFHYIADLPRLFATLHGALVPGGHLVFTMEHPVFMAPSHPAWMAAADGRRVWPLEGYAVEGERVTDWLAPGVVKRHRMLGTVLNSLVGAGFAFRRLEEWAPSPADLAANPALAEERDRPMMMLVAAGR